MKVNSPLPRKVIYVLDVNPVSKKRNLSGKRLILRRLEVFLKRIQNLLINLKLTQFHFWKVNIGILRNE